MALTVKVLSLLSRLAAPSSAMAALSANSCRFKSRDATAWMDQGHSHKASDRRPRRRQEMFEGDADMEDVEDKLQALIE